MYASIYLRGFKYKNIADIWGPAPQEKLAYQRKLYLGINYPYFENKILTFLISESKYGWAVDFVLRLQSINLLVRVSRPLQLVKNSDILGVEKWSASSLWHNTIAYFSKKSMVEDNKTQELNKSSIYEGEHWPLSGIEVEWTEKKQEHISVWENLLYNIYFLLIKFSQIVIRAFTCVLFFQM